MNNQTMSAAYQQHQYSNNFPTMDFPSDYLEPSISSAPIMQSKANPMFSPNAGCSSANSSLSSSQNRLVYDDSGVSSNAALADPSSSMHFLSSAMNSSVNDGMEQNPMGFGGNDFLDDLEPMVRDRSHTWPMKQPTSDFRANMTIQEGIQEEDEPSLYSKHASQLSVHLSQDLFPNNNAMNVGYPVHHVTSQDQELNYDSHNDYSDENSRGSVGEEDYQDDFQGGAVQKRSQTRRNAWGNMSYADLITQAILSSPDQRLTLSQIYEWMVANVPYFSDKGDSNSSAGWKNSIRHNLSLHSRFMRVQNEGAGKSSWWIINPDSKNRNPRRRQTIDSTTKHAIEKKRRGARKRVEMQQGSMNSLTGARKASQPDFYYNPRAKEEAENDSDYDSFRSRTLSNMSAPGGSQVSPTFNPNNDDFVYQSWAPNNVVQHEQDISNAQYNNCSTMKEIMSRTDQISLDTDGDLNQMAPMNTNQQLGVFSTVHQQVSPNFQDDIKPQFQQGSYQELKPVRGVNQRLQNPLLQQYAQPAQFQQTQFATNQQPQQNRSGNDYPFGCNNMNNQKRWQVNNGQQANHFVQQNGGIQQIQPVAESPIISPPISQPTTMASNFNRTPMANIPKDLENLNAFVPPDCDLQGIDAIIREELSTSNNLNFDF